MSSALEDLGIPSAAEGSQRKMPILAECMAVALALPAPQDKPEDGDNEAKRYYPVRRGGGIISSSDVQPPGSPFAASCATSTSAVPSPGKSVA